VSWQIINHYILDCHTVKLDLILSVDLCQILPPKMPFFVRKKSQISFKNFVTNPECLQFHQESIFSASFRHFVGFFCQKRNPLEPLHNGYLLVSAVLV